MKQRNSYRALLTEAQAFLEEGRFSASVQVSGRILEKALKDLLSRHWLGLDAKERAQIEKIQHDIAGDDRSIDRLTMGQLIGICRKGRVLERAQSSTAGSVKLLSADSLDPALKIRNAVTHSESEPRREEAQFVLDQASLLLAETGLLAGEKNPSFPSRHLVGLVLAAALVVGPVIDIS